MMLEEVLADLETTGFSRGAEGYTVTVFGMPGEEAPWAFRFEGHHLSLNVTVAPDAITVTPSFIGAAPAVIPSGARAGFNPLEYEGHVAFALLHSLNREQRAAAVLASDPPAEILSTQFQVKRANWDRWRTLLERDGVSASTFDAEQIRLLRRLLLEVVGTYRDEISRAYLRTIDLRTLTFAWMGGSERGQPYYFRIQGEDFVFELDAAQEAGNHIHTVWRDRKSDFGTGALERHYEQHDH